MRDDVRWKLLNKKADTDNLNNLHGGSVSGVG